MIYFFGDTHGCFEHVLDVVGLDHPAAVVFLGDLQAQRPLDIKVASILDKTEVWYIHGNHDTDSEDDYDNLFGSALADRNLHGRVAEIDGLRIAGLGGIFRGLVWAPPGEWLHERPEDFAACCCKGNLWRGCLPRKHRSSSLPGNATAAFCASETCEASTPLDFDNRRSRMPLVVMTGSAVTMPPARTAHYQQMIKRLKATTKGTLQVREERFRVNNIGTSQGCPQSPRSSRCLLFLVWNGRRRRQKDQATRDLLDPRLRINGKRISQSQPKSSLEIFERMLPLVLLAELLVEVAPIDQRPPRNAV